MIKSRERGKKKSKIYLAVRELLQGASGQKKKGEEKLTS